MKILDGLQVANKIYQNIQETLINCKTKRPPKLVAILVGADPASLIYIGNKQKACRNVGIESQLHHFTDCDQSSLLKLIHTLNNDDQVDGILVQLPLPKHIDVNIILESIAIHKDVDGFHPHNLGKLAQGSAVFKACTAMALETLLKETGRNIKGINAVVIGTSNIVGKPCILELLAQGATVTACNEYTKDLQVEVQRADLVVSAVGKPHIISGAWLKENVIAIDIGINRTSHGIVGDIDVSTAKNIAFYTPVPGGVGPVTVAMLIKNTMLAFAYNHRFANC